MKHWHCLGAAFALAGLVATAHADILVGQTVGVTGAVAATVKEAGAGARLFIDSVNAKGGIKGENVRRSRRPCASCSRDSWLQHLFTVLPLRATGPPPHLHCAIINNAQEKGKHE